MGQTENSGIASFVSLQMGIFVIIKVVHARHAITTSLHQANIIIIILDIIITFISFILFCCSLGEGLIA